MNTIPQDLVASIVGWLPDADRMALAETSREMRQAVHERGFVGAAAREAARALAPRPADGAGEDPWQAQLALRRFACQLHPELASRAGWYGMPDARYQALKNQCALGAYPARLRQVVGAYPAPLVPLGVLPPHAAAAPEPGRYFLGLDWQAARRAPGPVGYGEDGQGRRFLSLRVGAGDLAGQPPALLAFVQLSRLNPQRWVAYSPALWLDTSPLSWPEHLWEPAAAATPAGDDRWAHLMGEFLARGRVEALVGLFAPPGHGRPRIYRLR